ncbi:unnamed protein product, partial [Onchocerca flexuosa]|uniref:CULLIN_2 domain-containing protein n=1 Tax=Onchocerca flexuosa TaxID=387005 RepID=A0A183HD36_9BILA
MYTLCNRTENGLDKWSTLEEILEKHIARQGEATLDKIVDVAANNPKKYISTILKVHKRYHSLVTCSFKNEPIFVRALNKGCASFVNRNSVTRKTNNASENPKFLAQYCDQLLKKNAKNLEENELEEFLNQIMIVLKYVEDKDLFENFYIKMLAKRLVKDLSVSAEAENSMISKLTQMYGFAYTYKLRKMLDDNRLSKNIAEEFKQYLASENTNLGLDFSVNVIAFIVWPFKQSPVFDIPLQLANCRGSFNEFYRTKRPECKLIWLLAQSHGELSTCGFQKNYIFAATTAQMAILMLYNENTEMTLQQICDNTNLEPEIVLQIVKALVKMELLSIVGPKIDIDANTPLSTVLRLNSDF